LAVAVVGGRGGGLLADVADAIGADAAGDVPVRVVAVADRVVAGVGDRGQLSVGEVGPELVVRSGGGDLSVGLLAAGVVVVGDGRDWGGVRGGNPAGVEIGRGRLGLGVNAGEVAGGRDISWAGVVRRDVDRQRHRRRPAVGVVAAVDVRLRGAGVDGFCDDSE